MTMFEKSLTAATFAVALSLAFAPGTAFENPLVREFPTGMDCWIGPNSIVVPTWGAAFLNDLARRQFLDAFDLTPEFGW